MAFSDIFLEDLSDRSDIVDVVSDYVQLKAKGSSLMGLCPFHSEKTPSFSVSADRQVYHCFGCGAGGGVINFIMRAENLDFPEAVRFLAARVGIAVPEGDGEKAGERRARILEMNKIAARYFYDALMGEQGEAARAYLKGRGVTEKTVKKFGIGYAPVSWDGLISALNGFEKAEMLEARLVVRNKSGGVYDLFRGRVMFPIIDLRGNIVAFGGRILDNSEPKYLNSPETPVFSKSRNLFALNLAKKSKAGRLILAEGYMDVIALHQAGFDSAVASLGTSLTEAQARLMAKYAQEVVLAYDTDEAGRKAAIRAISILEKTGVQVRLLSYPGAKDPDEYIKKYGVDAFRLRLDRAENHIEYRLQLICEKYNLEADDERVSFLKEASELLCTLENPVERAVFSTKVAQSGNVSPTVVEQEVDLCRTRHQKADNRKELRRRLSPAGSLQPAQKELRYKNIRSAMAEERILQLIFYDEQMLHAAAQKIRPEDFSSDMLGNLYRASISLIESGKALTAAALAQELTPEDMEQFGRLMMRAQPEGDRRKAMEDYIDIVVEESRRRTGDATGNAEEHILKAWERMREKKGLGG